MAKTKLAVGGRRESLRQAESAKTEPTAGQLAAPGDDALLAAERSIGGVQAQRRSPLLLLAAQVLVDAVAIIAGFVLAYWLRFWSDIAPFYTSRPVSTYIFMLAITVLTLLVIFNVNGLYSLRRGTSRIDEFYKVTQAVSMGTFGAIAVNSVILGDALVYSRWILSAGWLLCILFVTVGRLAYSTTMGAARRRGMGQQRVLLIGMGDPANTIIERMRSHPEYGYQVSGVLQLDAVDEPRAVYNVPLLGKVADVAAISREQRIDEVIVAVSGAAHSDLLDIIARCEEANVSIRIYPDAFLLMTEKEVNVNDLGGLPLLSVKDVALRGWNRTLKRGFDLAFSSAFLIISAPLMLAVALLVKLDSPGPVFFIQERLGLDGLPISVIKFRSMRAGAESEPGWTIANDPRRTRIGQWLRRFSIDELPQFVNVLLGEMSVVGPRPEQPQYVQQFSQQIPGYMRRHTEKAGITGWAQVNGSRGDTSIEERTRYDLYYVENWSLLLDLKIIVRTVLQVLRGSAY